MNQKKIMISSTVIGVIILLCCFVIFNFVYQSKKSVGDILTHDIRQLADIFQRIHEKCRIIDFEYQKNPINFLNVRSFEGSEVGPMNLTFSDNWEGPYVVDNPTIQEKEYQVVRTHKGYFITPGDGVVLPNGKRVGTDIVLDEDADIANLAADKKALVHKGHALAVKLVL